MFNYKLATNIQRTFIYIVLSILLIVTIVPIWLLIVNATRSTTEIQQGLSILPSTHLIENYKILLGKGLNLPRGFANSMFLAVTSTIVTVYFSMLTAYGIVVYEFQGKKFFSNFIVVLVMIPMQLSIIGFYQYMSKLGLTDNYAALILPLIANAGAVFFGKQYLESMIMQDLIDAARIDGASELGIFHLVMMPLAVPGAATMGIFAFVTSWNNFFNAFILISSIDKYTLPMLVQTLRGDVYRTEFGAIYLGLAATIVPIIIIYALFSRYIVSGIAMGAIKE
ncbi:MAG: carbohydrate ABC transporter permease [Anaerolineales bacterium]|jgi:multiple sugar transport system permease protein|uniref:carbohydrate ABC transporter permease n=1 Tax=Candidatus Villigracilis affinis TaxID=3140682 RepID=UPI001E07BB3C|nr:carbohydrate ABC transporter permease [Anaerolineales bacterium]MBK9601479.1 carbohydrate ABC transporter permease [Anaerolineales bacterium]MBL0345023.1 carbohydrate ABC transporter permease [Anaerolineales bacterium]